MRGVHGVVPIEQDTAAELPTDLRDDASLHIDRVGGCGPSAARGKVVQQNVRGAEHA